MYVPIGSHSPTVWAMTAPDIPLWATVHLTHAALQAVADEVGADVLHVKGPATDGTLRAGRHDSTDADVLVRPAHLDRYLAGLEARGWVQHSGFAEGSSFGHAANYRHPVWTFADVHRLLPGPTATPEAVFDRLWRDHVPGIIAHRTCAVPALPAQVLVQTLHAARSHGREAPEAWSLASDGLRADVRGLAGDLGAEVALAAGLGELSRHAGEPEHALWHYWSHEERGRLEEWLARLRSARTTSERMGVVGRMLRVNRTHLRLRLGHEPRRAEIALEHVARARRAVVALSRRPGWDLVWRRLR